MFFCFRVGLASQNFLSWTGRWAVSAKVGYGGCFD